MKLRHLVPSLLLFLSATAFAQAPWSGLLSPKRATDWTKAGAAIPTGTIPACATQPATPITMATIEAAIAADMYGSSYCQINIPAGNYDVTGSLVVMTAPANGQANIVISGAGPDQTRLVWDKNAILPPPATPSLGICNGLAYTAVCIYNADQETDDHASQFQNLAQVTGGLTQGSTQITLANIVGPVALRVGSLIEFAQADSPTDNGNAWFCSSTGFTGACSQQGGDGAPDIVTGDPGYAGTTDLNANLSQLVLVTACGATTYGATCTSNTVTIGTPIAAPNWSSTAYTVATWSNRMPASNVGIQNITIDVSKVISTNNVPTPVVVRRQPTMGIIVECHLCENVWFSNMATINGTAEAPQYQDTNPGDGTVMNWAVPGQAAGNHFLLWQSNHITVQNSYMYGSNPKSEGYGIDWAYATSDSLAINNIAQHIATAYITEHSNGDVYAYNYAVDNYFGSNWQQCDALHHDGGDYDDLWEGNIGICAGADDIHGSSLWNTYYRNFYSGYDPATEDGWKLWNTLAFADMAHARYSNLVGNVLGTAGYHNTYENVGIGGNPNDCTQSFDQTAVYRLGFGDQNQIPFSPNCINSGFTIDNDNLVATTMMRWGNYDVVTGGVQENPSETGSNAPVYPGVATPSTAFPSSFFLSAQPLFWQFPKGTAAPWPAIGPDISGGNIAGTGGYAWQNPAANCYLNVLGGKVDGSSGPMYSFNANGCYGSTPVAATPVITPGTGAYGSAQTVTITDAASGAAIYYTTDGSVPTNASTAYTAPLSVASSTTVNAVAVASGAPSSAVASAAITIGSMTLVQKQWYEMNCTPACPALPINSTGAGNLLVVTALGFSNISSVSCSPNCGAWVVPGAVCQASALEGDGQTDCAYVLSSEPGGNNIQVTLDNNVGNEVLHVREYHSTVGAAFSFDNAQGGFSPEPGCTSEPVLYPGFSAPCVSPSLSLSGSNDVVIAAGIADYPMESMNPPYGDVMYESQGTIVGDVLNTTSGAGATINQFIQNYHWGNPDAAMVTMAFTDAPLLGAPVAAAPVFSPAAGSYNGTQTVTISDGAVGAAIYYTTDGSTPTVNSTLYTDPITVAASETVNAIALASGDALSPVASAAYSITPPTFTLSIPVQLLTITSGTEGTVSVIVTPQYGFNAPVTFGCSAAPVVGSGNSGLGCVFAPVTVTPNGGPVTTSLTIITNSAQTAALHRNSSPLFPGAVLAFAVGLFGWRKRRGLGLALLAVAFTGLGLLSGCGGGTFNPAPVTSTVTVTATSGSNTQTATFTVTVN